MMLDMLGSLMAIRISVSSIRQHMIESLNSKRGMRMLSYGVIGLYNKRQPNIRVLFDIDQP